MAERDKVRRQRGTKLDLEFSLWLTGKTLFIDFPNSYEALFIEAVLVVFLVALFTVLEVAKDA